VTLALNRNDPPPPVPHSVRCSPITDVEFRKVSELVFVDGGIQWQYTERKTRIFEEKAVFRLTEIHPVGWFRALIRSTSVQAILTSHITSLFRQRLSDTANTKYYCSQVPQEPILDPAVSSVGNQIHMPMGSQLRLHQLIPPATWFPVASPPQYPQH
jgi:hypothetical protein